MDPRQASTELARLSDEEATLALLDATIQADNEYIATGKPDLHTWVNPFVREFNLLCALCRRLMVPVPLSLLEEFEELVRSGDRAAARVSQCGELPVDGYCPYCHLVYLRDVVARIIAMADQHRELQESGVGGVLIQSTYVHLSVCWLPMVPEDTYWPFFDAVADQDQQHGYVDLGVVQDCSIRYSAPLATERMTANMTHSDLPGTHHMARIRVVEPVQFRQNVSAYRRPSARPVHLPSRYLVWNE